jgi:hypothetical protein
VVHSSLSGLLLAALAPTFLLWLGLAAVSRGGWSVFPTILVVAGVATAAVVLIDLPRRSVFDHEGVTRVCWARRQHLPWERIVAIERARPSTASIALNAVDRRAGAPPRVSGGLVARGSGRRRWLLSDQIESRDEHERLGRLLEDVPRPVVLRAPRPHPGAPPTGLYRRSP